MNADAVTIGMRVRYPRTGTTGTVTRLESSGGTTFAELDTTSLLYRVDQLVPAKVAEKKSTKIIEDAKEKIAKEREYVSGGEYAEALKNIDQSCEGGG